MNALTILRKNVQSLDLEYIISPVCADIRNFEISRHFLPINVKITTVMNPPFGVKTKSSDRPFLIKAFSFSDVIYSIHLSSKKTQDFISNFIERFNWKIDNIIPYNMILENSFPFHSQKSKNIEVDVYRFIKE